MSLTYYTSQKCKLAAFSSHVVFLVVEMFESSILIRIWASGIKCQGCPVSCMRVSNDPSPSLIVFWFIRIKTMSQGILAHAHLMYSI